MLIINGDSNPNWPWSRVQSRNSKHKWQDFVNIGTLEKSAHSQKCWWNTLDTNLTQIILWTAGSYILYLCYMKKVYDKTIYTL